MIHLHQALAQVVVRRGMTHLALVLHVLALGMMTVLAVALALGQALVRVIQALAGRTVLVLLAVLLGIDHVFHSYRHHNDFV